MNIILSNYRYFISGGPEKYLFNVKHELEKRGCGVYPFSVKSKRNLKSEYESAFMSPLGSDDGAAYFHEYKKDFKTISKILSRQFYSLEGRRKARELAQKTKPDAAYVLHFLNKMSPSIIDGFKDAGIPVVLRISDFGLICPQAHLFQGDAICEECVGGGFFPAIKKKCVKNSRVGSIIKFLAWNLHKSLDVYNKVDAFIFPSEFTRKKYMEAGFPGEKSICIPTFINAAEAAPTHSQSDSILYFGRLNKEKGVHLLVNAYAEINIKKPKLVIIGDIRNNEYADNLMERSSANIEFHDFMAKEKLSKFINDSLFTVVPSLWYDNLPNVVLEAYSFGKPVIAPNHGCFPELVKHQKTGLLFEWGDENDLREKMELALNNRAETVEMGKNARDLVLAEHSPEKHLAKLLDVFSLVGGHDLGNI